MPKNPSVKTIFFLITLLLLTVWHWAILIFRIPIFFFIPGWFWGFLDKSWGNVPAFFMILVPAAIVARVVWMDTKFRFEILFVFILSGYSMQHGFALLEGKGIDGIRNRIVASGHAEFADIATKQTSIWSTMVHYEDLVREHKLGSYSETKPPGQLLLYMVTERVGNAISPRSVNYERLERIANFASAVWPLISYLVLFPLFWLGRILTDERTSLISCALYLFIPSVSLITLHTDQVFFPLFAVVTILIGVLAMRKQSMALGFLTGLVFYFSVFFSFGMLFLAPLIVLIALVQGWQTRQFGDILLPLIASVAGTIVGDLVLRLTLNYDILARFQYAVTHHEAWKHFIHAPYYVSVLGNLIELGVWLGIPVALLAVASFIRPAARLSLKNLTSIESFSIAFGVSVLLLDIFGKTRAEVARLWLFIVPFACLMAASQFEEMVGKERAARNFAVLLMLQLVTVYLTKVNQDFW